MPRYPGGKIASGSRYLPQSNKACVLLDQQDRLLAALDLVQVSTRCLWERNCAGYGELVAALLKRFREVWQAAPRAAML